MSGAIRRRQGHWNQAVTSMRRALAGDPRNAQIAREILYTVCMMRDWPAAARDAERAVALAPDNPMIPVEKGHVDYWASRNLAPLRAVLTAAPAEPDPDGQLTLARWDAALLARDFTAAERAVAASARENVVTKDACAGPIPAGLLALIYVHAGETERALALIKHLLQTPAALSPVFDGCITQSDLQTRWQWDPLRAAPRFQALLSGPESKTVYK